MHKYKYNTCISSVNSCSYINSDVQSFRDIHLRLCALFVYSTMSTYMEQLNYAQFRADFYAIAAASWGEKDLRKISDRYL